MNRVFLVLSLIAILIFTSCGKDEDGRQYYWEQTKCSDPWGTGENDSNLDTTNALKDFLKDNSINILSINFDNNSTLDVRCESCGCGTGQRMLISVPELDEEKIENLGFLKV